MRDFDVLKMDYEDCERIERLHNLIDMVRNEIGYHICSSIESQLQNIRRELMKSEINKIYIELKLDVGANNTNPPNPTRPISIMPPRTQMPTMATLPTMSPMAVALPEACMAPIEPKAIKNQREERIDPENDREEKMLMLREYGLGSILEVHVDEDKNFRIKAKLRKKKNAKKECIFLYDSDQIKEASNWAFAMSSYFSKLENKSHQFSRLEDACSRARREELSKISNEKL